MTELQLLLHELDDNVLVFNLSGELDMATAPTFKEAARKALDSKQYRCMVFDLTALSFIDSTGLHVLVECRRELVAAGGQVRVVNSSRGIQKVFELTGLDHVLNVVPDRETALANVA